MKRAINKINNALQGALANTLRKCTMAVVACECFLLVAMGVRILYKTKAALENHVDFAGMAILVGSIAALHGVVIHGKNAGKKITSDK